MSPSEAVQCYCSVFILLFHGKEKNCIECGRINLMLGASVYSGDDFVYKMVSEEWVTREDYDREYEKVYKEWLEAKEQDEQKEKKYRYEGG